MQKPRAAIYGPWFLFSDGTRTRARRLDHSESVDLEGQLHESVWAGGQMLRALREVNPVFGSIFEALAGPSSEPTLEQLLRGRNGWGVLFLELTGRCNESCRHCYAGSSPQVETALTLSVIEQTIRDARALDFGCLQLIGGDPLISPHIERAVCLAADLEFQKIEVFTNGLALNARLLELFVSHGVYLAFSLYSHDAAIHDEVTQTRGSHARTSRAISQAIHRGLHVRVAGVEGCVDGQDEARLRAYIAELGVNDANVWVDRQRPVGRGEWTEKTELLAQDSPTRHADKGFPGRAKLCVTYSGDLVPCIFDRDTVLGNVNTETLRQALKRPVFPSSTRKALTVVGEPLACFDCRSRRALLADLSWT